MKVLARINDEGFIIQVNNEEMSNILGDYLTEQQRRELVGKNLGFSKMYRNAREVLEAYDGIKSAVATLKTASTKILDFVKEKESPIAAKIQGGKESE